MSHATPAPTSAHNFGENVLHLTIEYDDDDDLRKCPPIRTASLEARSKSRVTQQRINKAKLFRENKKIREKARILFDTRYTSSRLAQN